MGIFKMNLHSLNKDRIVTQFLKLKTYTVANLLFVGLILRLLLAPFTTHPYDIVVLYKVTNDLLAGLNVYTSFFSYPPLWAYIEYPALGLVSFFTSPKLFGVQVGALNLPVENWKLPPIITSPLFNVLCKLPLIIADVLIGIIIYNIVKELRDEKYAKLSFLLWFFNPLVICIDSVHGQFDVLPALMTVLSFCLFCKRKYFASGIAISLGVLFKLYPLFLVPLYLFSIIKLETSKSSSASENYKKIFAECLKFAVGMLISFSIFLLPLINSNLLHNIFTRTEVITSLGGLTIFNIIYCPGLEWLLPLISSNSVVISISLTVLCVIMTMFICSISFFRRNDFLKTFVLGHIAILLTTYATSLTVNPQYMLWILPFLILSYGLYHHNLIKLNVLSISALGFLIGLSGPLFFFYPLAIFTPFLSVETIYTNVYYFEHVGGWVILLISGVSGMVVLMLCLKDTMMLFLKAGSKSEMLDNTQRGKRGNGKHLSLKFKWHMNPLRVLTLVLMVLIIGQFLAYSRLLMRQDVNFYVYSANGQDENDVKIEYRVKSGGYPIDIQIFVTPVTSMHQGTVDKEVFIYYDEDYPSSLVGRAGWIGLLDHIPVELELRGYNGSIKIVNATELKSTMQENYNSIVIIPSGVFPDTVHTKSESLVGSWLRSGGTLIWIGDMFAYFSGHKGNGVETFSEDNGCAAQNLTLGFILFNGTLKESERFATFSSNFSDALDLRYPDALVGASVSEIRKHKGVVLGKTTSSEDARTSIAYIPVGGGHLILFGGGVGRAFTATGEDVIAHDIAQILCSGFPFSTGIAAYNFHELDRNEEKNGSINMALPEGEYIKGVIVAAFSKSPYVRFFTRRFYPVNGH